MISWREQLWQPPRTREQQHQDDDQVKNLEDENDALRKQISVELSELDEECQRLEYRMKEAHETLMPLLDDLFWNLGALPDFNNPDIELGVRVFENRKEDAWNNDPETGWSNHHQIPYDLIFGGGKEPEETFHHARERYYRENPVLMAEYEVERAIKAYKQVSMEFDEFRNNYNGDLYWYIARHHKFRMYHNNKSEIAELEQQFDAEWFVKYRHITRRLNRAEMLYRDAEKERLEAERLTASADNFNQPAGRLAPIPSEDDVEAFGHNLSSTQFKRIDDWLELIPSIDDVESIPSDDGIEALAKNLSPGKRKRTNDGLDDNRHSKRQRAEQEYDVDDTVAMLDLPEHFSWIETWEMATGYERQLIDEYAQESRQAWEQTKARL